MLGSAYGVFGHEEQTLTDLGEQFQLRTTSAVIKARDRALKKLAKNCMAGKLGVWKDVYHAVMECARYPYEDILSSTLGFPQEQTEVGST